MNYHTAYEREVVALRGKVADLQAELQDMRSQLAPSIAFPQAWKLDPTERRIVGSLYASPNGFRAKDILREVMSRDWREREDNLLSVRICKLRKKLRAANTGIQIKTIHCGGYEMPKESREIVRRAVEMAEAA